MKMLLLLLLLMWNDNEVTRAVQGCGPEKVNYTKPLTSPGFPEDYPNNMDCIYLVSIPTNTRVTIVFNYFELEDQDDKGSCSFDYLQISYKDKQTTDVLKTICGKTDTTYTIPFAVEVIVLKFHTDSKNQEKGFYLTFKLITVDTGRPVNNCGSFVINNTLKSPGYPDNYPNDLDCKWEVPIPQNMTMSISIIFFDLEYDSLCEFDYLTITHDKEQKFSKYCGQMTRRTIYSTGDEVLITFHSDGSKQGGGFVINFIALPHVPPRIMLDRAALTGLRNQVWCSATGSPPIYIALVLMRTHTVLVNTTKTARAELYEEGNYTCVATSKYGTDVKEFVVKGCRPVINNTLKSPGHPGNYPNNTDCSSLVPIPQGSSAMNVSFKEFYLEKSESCNRDYLIITNEKDHDLGKYCGNETGRTVLVTGNYTLVKFHSDSSIQQRGFVLHFTAVPLVQELRKSTQENVAETVQATAQAIQENMIADKTATYVFSAIASIMLLFLCCVLGFLCYRRSNQKRETRTFREIIPLDKWELLPEQIEYEEELGRGAFGVVYKATLQRRVGIEVFDNSKRLKPKDESKLVAVKVLQDDPSEDQKEEFLHEIEQMKLLGSHQNIVSLVGCCTLQEHKFLVIEYVPFGDLLQWLRRRRRTNSANSDNQENIELMSWPSTLQGKSNPAMLLSTENLDNDDDEADSFTTQQLFSFAWQIARGMNHLAEKDFIHRDLAARNILVGSDNRVKVSDFGLMRQIYEDVYSAKKTKKLPVKWMAPESIFDSIYTIKSDVWSFGILLWEMATMGVVPYPTLTNSELCRLLKSGYRMERPDMCCDEVYELMSECWREDPSTRPSFSQLIDRLEVIMAKDVPYCDVSKLDESSAYYNVLAKANEHSV
ncbi:hypothetical protein ACROYT_G000968 [Oculina patagonica]